MLHFILNYDSLFGCIDYLKAMGFNDNSFIVGPLYRPKNMNLLNLPQSMLDRVLHTLRDRIADKPTGYLKNSYENLLAYYTDTQWQRDIQDFLKETDIRDRRRGTDCKKIFPKLFQELHVNTLE
jgi:hypothetical protein